MIVRAENVDGQPYIAVCRSFTDTLDIEANARLISAAPDLLAACKAFNNYWNECARRWHENDGRVGRAVEGGAVVVGEDLDELAETASRLVIAAIAKAEGNAQ